MQVEILDELQVMRTFSHAADLMNRLEPAVLEQAARRWSEQHGGYGPAVPSPLVMNTLLSLAGPVAANGALLAKE
jgi:hypothetical protein